MMRIHGFSWLAEEHAHTLILGSMPGRASLEAGRYYAHPRNAFWPILARILELPPETPYPGAVDALRARGFALWDVLGSCTRTTSLDADIRPESMVPNDFAAFFDRFPGIDRIFFNGAAAETIFRRRVLPGLGARGARYTLTRLPSTSPAYASLGLEEKFRAWSVIAPE